MQLSNAHILKFVTAKLYTLNKTKHQKSKTLTYELFKCIFKRILKSKREISRLWMNKNHYYHIKTENPINGCCSKSIQSIKWDAQA